MPVVEKDCSVKYSGTEEGGICHIIEMAEHPPMLHASLTTNKHKQKQTGENMKICKQTNLIMSHQASTVWLVVYLYSVTQLPASSFLFYLLCIVLMCRGN